MTTAKESNRFTHLRKLAAELRQFATHWQQVLVAWCQLAVQLARCLQLTVKMFLRTILWIARQLSPIPTPVNPYQERYRKRSTGMPIPALEVSMLVVGAVIALGKFS